MRGMKSFTSRAIILVLLILRPSCVLSQTTYVAQFVRVRGDVTLTHGNISIHAYIMGKIQNGDRINVGKMADTRILLLKTGEQFTLDAGSSVTVRGSGIVTSSGPKPRPMKPLDRRLMQAYGGLPHSQPIKFTGTIVRGQPKLNSPSPIGAVMTNTPNLQWQGTPEAGDRVTSSSLVVSIRDVETDSELYYKEGIPRLARSFKVPANKLKPGRRYVWSVVSVEDADSNVQFTAPLRILTSSERSRIKQVERAAKSTQAANPKDSAPTLLLADAYEQLEMWAEAKGAYEAAQRLDPLLELETKLIELKKRLTVN